MHHGYDVLDKAISKLNNKDRNQFRKFVNENTSFNPHIMFISKKKIINNWFNDLFSWLFKCENEFKNLNLEGYEKKRIYGFLAERFMPYWFKKNFKTTTCQITFFDN